MRDRKTTFLPFLKDVKSNYNPSPEVPSPFPAAWLKKPEMAALLGVSVRTLEKLVRTGIVPCVRLTARCVRFDPAKVREASRALETLTVAQVVARRGSR